MTSMPDGALSVSEAASVPALDRRASDVLETLATTLNYNRRFIGRLAKRHFLTVGLA